MAQDTHITTVAAQAMLDALTTLFSGGHIRIYSGSIPPTVETTVGAGNFLLATIALPNPAFPASVDANPGVMATANPTTPVNAALNGIGSFFRALNSSNTAVLQGTIGTVAGAFDMIVDNITFVQNNPVNIASWVMKLPRAASEPAGSG